MVVGVEEAFFVTFALIIGFWRLKPTILYLFPLSMRWYGVLISWSWHHRQTGFFLSSLHGSVQILLDFLMCLWPFDTLYNISHGRPAQRQFRGRPCRVMHGKHRRPLQNSCSSFSLSGCFEGKGWLARSWISSTEWSARLRHLSQHLHEKLVRSWFVEPLKTILSAKTALVPVLVQQSGYGHWSQPAPTRVPHSLFLNCSLIDTFFGSRLILFKGCLSVLERILLSLREEGNTTVEKLTPSQEVDDSRWDGTTASSSSNGSS